MQIQNDVSLLPYNTFGIDVQTKTFFSYQSEEELISIIKHPSASLPKPWLHIGEGSNLLFLNHFPGTILRSSIKELSVLEETPEYIIIRVGAGWNMDQFIEYAISNGWYGIENLSNIPGQVGSSAVQNIGAYGIEIAEFIQHVNCIRLDDASKRTFTQKECGFDYRHSIFKTPEYKGKYAITSVEYRLNRKFIPRVDYGGINEGIIRHGKHIDTITACDLRNIIIEIRGCKLPDPKKQGNAGSFFMNPIVDRIHFEKILTRYPNMPRFEIDDEHIKIPAAWLIEQCGWKGKHLGNAGVHDVQPLILVNTGGASGKEIASLSDKIRETVYNQFGIDLKPEVNFI